MALTDTQHQHVTLSVRNSLRGFLDRAGDTNRTTAFFSRLSEQTQVAKSTIFVTSILIGDAFLTYRLWVVWNRSWMIIIVPIGMLLGTASKSTMSRLLLCCSSRSDGDDLQSQDTALAEI